MSTEPTQTDGPAMSRPTAGHETVDVFAAAGTGFFDDHHTPSRERLDDCVHCGFCLPTCPTYQLWGEEMDSPRGRIYLMAAALEGDTPIDETWVGHLDACLGCMACVTACPSGVRYDELIEATRPQIERNFRRSLSDRAFRGLLFALFPYRRRLRVGAVLGWLYQRAGIRALVARSGLRDRLPARLRALESLLPPIGPRAAVRRTPARTVPDAPVRRRVGFVTGCVQEVFFGDVNAATVRVLAAEGVEVIAPSAQQCCGALEVHSGRERSALARARALIDTFAGLDVDAVVVNAAGCGSTLKEYGRLLADDPLYAGPAAAFAAKVRDVTEVLADLDPRGDYGALDLVVAYHDACHLAHAQGIRSQPRQVLSRVPGLALRDVPDGELCCGSAGVYNLLQPEAAEELGRRKADAIRSTGAAVVATTNPGCALQIARALQGPVVHPVQVLDAALRREPASALTRSA